MHSSTTVANTVAVIGGFRKLGQMLSTIELLQLRLKPDLSIGFCSKNWRSCDTKVELRFLPFTSALDEKNILIAGGIDRANVLSDSVHVFNIQKRMIEQKAANAFTLYATSQGSCTPDGSVIGLI